MMCLISPSFPRPAGRRLKRSQASLLAGAQAGAAHALGDAVDRGFGFAGVPRVGGNRSVATRVYARCATKTVINVEGESRRLLDDYRKLGARRLFCRRG